MLAAVSTPHNRKVALVWLGVGALCLVGAVAVGISDNPPGIVLAMLAASAGVLVVVHPWRTARRFRFLFYGGALGFAIGALLHNVFYALGTLAAGHSPLDALLEGLDVAFFLVAVLVCPAAIVVGAVGAIAMLILTWLRRSTPKAT